MKHRHKSALYRSDRTDDACHLISTSVLLLDLKIFHCGWSLVTPHGKRSDCICNLIVSFIPLIHTIIITASFTDELTLHNALDSDVYSRLDNTGTLSDFTTIHNRLLPRFTSAEVITGWAVALTCCISHSAMHRKKADFDPPGGQNP